MPRRTEAHRGVGLRPGEACAATKAAPGTGHAGGPGEVRSMDPHPDRRKPYWAQVAQGGYGTMDSETRRSGTAGMPLRPIRTRATGSFDATGPREP